MRVLLLLRGSAGVGKSTYVKEHGLEPYTLSADNIRMMCQSPVMQTNGTLAISQSNERLVWSLLFQMLEARMQRGEFVVIDATNSKTQEINRYKDMAKTYRYRMYCVDMTGVPMEECKRRNKLRPIYKQVPDEVIEKMYARFETQSIPAGVTVIQPDELDKIWYKPSDFSHYKRIHHIGDIHGCYTVMMNAVIVNPRTTIPQDQPESVILDYAYKALDDCEAIVFSTFSGMIGHGVFNEIIYAFNAGKKVYQLDGTECIEIRSYTDFIEHGIRDFIFRGDNRMYAVVNSPCW